MKQKHLRDHTWPILPVVRSCRFRRLQSAPFLLVEVEYFLIAQEVPVDIQGVRLGGIAEMKHGYYPLAQPDAPFGGLDDRMAPYEGAKDVKLTSKTPSRIFTSLFELAEPTGKEICYIHPVFAIEGYSLRCSVEMTTVDVQPKTG